MVARRSYSTAAAPTTLTVGIDNAVTSITVQDGSSYVDATAGPSVLTIDRGKSNEERVLYTSRVGNTFSGLTRGYNGTAAQSHTAGAIVEHTSTQQDFDEANAHVADPARNDHTQYVRSAAHYLSTGSAPAVAIGSGSGSGATVSVVGTDTRGIITILTGTGTAAGLAMVTVTFASPYASAPAVVITPLLVTAAVADLYLAAAPSTTGFVVQGNATPPASDTIKFSYMVVG